MAGRSRWPPHAPGVSGPVPVASYIDAYNNTFDKNAVKDKLVFVGLTAIGFADDWQALTSSPDTGKMSGVEVHAQTAEMILRGGYLVPQDTTTTVIAILLLSVVSGFIMARFPPFVAGGITLALLVTVLVAAALYAS